MGPRALPADLLDARMRSETERWARVIAEAFAKIGAKAEPASPEQLSSYLAQQLLRWAKIAEATGISVDE